MHLIHKWNPNSPSPILSGPRSNGNEEVLNTLLISGIGTEQDAV